MHQRRAISEEVAGKIGAEVARERNRIGLRQYELALIAGVSTRVIHQIEAGKPTSRLDSVVPVLDALGLELRTEKGQGSSAVDSQS